LQLLFDIGPRYEFNHPGAICLSGCLADYLVSTDHAGL
jgi:hypothetical protein